MKGYPKYIATKQDFLNLLEVDEFKAKAIEDMKIIYNLEDDKAIRVVSGSEEIEDLVTEKVDNPMPLWKIKGFGSREEIAQIIIGNGGSLS